MKLEASLDELWRRHRPEDLAQVSDDEIARALDWSERVAVVLSDGALGYDAAEALASEQLDYVPSLLARSAARGLFSSSQCSHPGTAGDKTGNQKR
ncbi:MAG: hypothetical protein KKA16_14815 [Alphaproteobacteria bacterium]|uniref:Uncharacterized protein n=1 Tax=viral metagenome TaxID=1070528 RepID=A0A6H1ZI91_9ZZZZ|nr:hypothetical protein [Alphaproteobacteria bacterium]MBU2379201.1 hypothetical protein [Alphaproteobacteria bacterium]